MELWISCTGVNHTHRGSYYIYLEQYLQHAINASTSGLCPVTGDNSEIKTDDF